MRRRWTVCLAAAVCATCFANTAAAEPPAHDYRGALAGDTIGLVIAPELAPWVVEEATGLWWQCSEYGKGFPAFVSDRPGTRTLMIEYRQGAIGNGRCGSFRASTIHLYDAMVDSAGRIHSCGSLSQNLAHELGHALGLADVEVGARCERAIMSPICRGNAYSRVVHPQECQVVDRLWSTRNETREARLATNDLRPAPAPRYRRHDMALTIAARSWQDSPTAHHPAWFW